MEKYIDLMMQADRYLTDKEKSAIELYFGLNADSAAEYNALKVQYPDALVGFEQNGQFEFYGEDARKICELTGGKLLERETALGTVTVTGFLREQWVYRAKQLWECGENIYLAGLNEDGTHHQTKYLRREEYLPVGSIVHMEGREFRVDKVDFDKDSVALQDMALADLRMPIFREAPLAVVRELYEQEPEPPVLVSDGLGLPGEDSNKLPVSIEVNEVPTTPEAAAAEEGLNEEGAPELAGNFRITDEELGAGGPKQKFARNIKAIKTLFTLEQGHRGATAEEQQVLSQYVGWGGLADAFDPDKNSWAKEYAELKGLLSEEEYKAARGSVLNAHYTSPTIIRAIYDAVERMGFRTGNILEPSMGVGNFFGMLPESMADSRLYGVELDSITGRIAQKLYLEANIKVAGFETTDRRDFYDLAVGNVPFGNYKVNDKLNISFHHGITEVLHIGVCRQGPALRFRLCNVRHLRSSFQILPFQLLYSLTELVCQICTFYRDDRSFFFAILCVFSGQFAQNHLRVVRKVAVDGDAICRLSQLHPCRFMIHGPVAFLQKDDVTDNISARIGAECVVWQADCSQQIRTLRNMLPGSRILTVQRIAAGDKCHNAAGPHLVDGFRKEIIVDADVQLVIRFLKKKKAEYPSYRKARERMQELMKAQKNVEMFFADNRSEQEQQQTR